MDFAYRGGRLGGDGSRRQLFLLRLPLVANGRAPARCVEATTRRSCRRRLDDLGVLRRLGATFRGARAQEARHRLPRCFSARLARATSAWTEATERELEHLKESGKVRAIGISIHDRMRAGQLAEESPLDLFMIRYNAAHPGAERDIFPHLARRQPAVVAYTATSWRKLLKAPSKWDGRP